MIHNLLLRQKFLLFLVLFYFKFGSTAQTHKAAIYLPISVNQFDIFSGVGYKEQRHYFNYQVAFETGIIKTVFQRRIFPRFTLGVQYSRNNSRLFQLKPTVNYHFSVLNLNRTSIDLHFWNELMVGYQFLYGRRLKFFQSAAIGGIRESFHSTLKNQNVFFLGYVFNLGLQYEL